MKPAIEGSCEVSLTGSFQEKAGEASIWDDTEHAAFRQAVGLDDLGSPFQLCDSKIFCNCLLDPGTYKTPLVCLNRCKEIQAKGTYSILLEAVILVIHACEYANISPTTKLREWDI